MLIHRIKETEDIYTLSREYSIAPEMLMENNGVYGVKRPPKDTEILITIPTRTYNVRRGETLSSIARKFAVSEEYLKQINPSLHGRSNVYPSQILAIKYQDRLFGSCVSNGYFYQGCSIDKLICALPYTSYITICTAVANGGKIELIFPDEGVINIAKKNDKRVLLRIYLPNIPDSENGKNELINSAILLATAHRYDGITLSPPNKKVGASEEYINFISNFKEASSKSNLTLFTEADIEAIHEYSKRSDSTILTYDKLHLKQIPTFLEGEYAKMQTFADNFDTFTAFVELPSFAFDGKKYVPCEEVARKITKRRLSLCHDNECQIIRCNSKREEYVMESLENTKSKLEAISELGFMGVSFDIMRTDIRVLFLLSQMFAIASMPSVEARLRCDGSEKSE